MNPAQSKTVMVTGATGALGRAVLARLARDARFRVVTAGRQGCDLRFDLRDAEQIRNAVASAQADWILHLAATFSGEFDEACTSNVDAARHLLDAVLASGRECRVVLIGSAAEYGVVQPEQNPVGEDRVLAPVSVYGTTKAWQTQLASLYAARGADVVVARIFNLEGPGLGERLFAGRLQRQIDDVLGGRKQSMEFGPLGAVRDYISTADAAEQLLAIASGAIAGGVYHVASGTPVRMRDLMLRRLAEHGIDPAIVQEAPELTNRSGYDVPVIYADIRKTMELMNNWRAGGNA